MDQSQDAVEDGKNASRSSVAAAVVLAGQRASVPSSSEAVQHDDDKSTVKELSDDGLSHEGTVVCGGLSVVQVSGR